MDTDNKKIAAAGLIIGLACGVMLAGIIGGWYWLTRHNSPPPHMRLQAVPPVARAVPAPASRSALTPPDAVDAWKHYNPPTTPLVTPPSIPSPYGALPTRRSDFVAGRIGDLIVAVGGFCRTPTYMLEVNELLDLSGRAWRQGGVHPIRLCGAAGAVADGRLYVAGGFDGTRIRTEMFAYSPAADAWEARAPLPYARQCATAVTFSDGKIYYIGHQGQGKDPYIVQVYDPIADAWEARTAPCGVGFGAVAVELADRIFVFGGADQRTNRRKEEVMVYYPAADRWERATQMPVARIGAAAAVWEDKIYVFGGNPDSVGVIAQVDVFDPATDRWTRAHDMAAPRLRHAAVVVDDGILLLGGSDNHSNSYDAAELYVP